MDVNKMLADIRKQICYIQERLNLGDFGSPAWLTAGNPEVKEDQFLGSINDSSLVFKTFNIERARITNAGLFGILTDTPSAPLDVNGQIRIRGGSPGAGKILQSDTNGLGTWVTPAVVAMSARNGLSVNTGNVVLGQNISEGGDPSILLSNREIPMGGFTIAMRDTSGNSNTLGSGTLISTRIGGVNITSTNTVTSNIAANNYTPTSIVTFNGGFNSYGLASYTVLATKRFNTITAGNTLSTTPTVRHGSVFGSLGFENDVAASNNPITISGSNPLSVYMAKVDLWPGAQNQIKTITGTIAGYSTYFDVRFVNSSSLESYVDFDAGRGNGNVLNPFTITNRYGFRVVDMTGNNIVATNRWAFSQEGATDSNYFAGLTGFGISAPTSKIHIVESITGTSANSTIEINPTWNTTGAPTAFKLNIINTASNATSLLIDAQIGGSSRFKVTRFITDIAGQIAIRGGAPGAGKILTSDGSGLATWEPASGGGSAIKPYVSVDFDPDGITVTDVSLNGKTFELYLNDLNRFLYNEVGNQEWDYVVGGGFEILVPGFDANTISYHIYLFVK